MFLFPAPHAASKRSEAGAQVSPDLQADSSPLEGSGAHAGGLPFQEPALKENTGVAVGSCPGGKMSGGEDKVRSLSE